MIIDMDTHILPRDVYDYVEGPLADKKPQFEFDAEGLLVKWSFPGAYHVKGTTPLPPPGSGGKHKGLSDMDVRLEDYAKLGIEKQLLLPQLSAIYFNYTLDPELAIQMAHSHNLAILNLLKKYPNELIGAALVALQDVPSAISEMEWAKKNGFQAITIDKVFPVREHQFSETLGSHRELWPFFKRAEELGMPLIMHNVQHGHRISNLMVFQRDGLDTLSPAEGQLSLVSLCTSGLFDDFPNLKAVFTEAGSAFIKPLIDRLDAAFVKPPLNYEDEDATGALSPPRRARQRAAVGGQAPDHAGRVRSQKQAAGQLLFQEEPLFHDRDRGAGTAGFDQPARRLAVSVRHRLSARRSGRPHEIQGRRAFARQCAHQRSGQGTHPQHHRRGDAARTANSAMPCNQPTDFPIAFDLSEAFENK